MPGFSLVPFHIILMTPQGGKSNHSHFTDEETGTWRFPHLRSYTEEVVNRIDPSLLTGREWLFTSIEPLLRIKTEHSKFDINKCAFHLSKGP